MIEILKARSGLTTAKLNGLFIHSSYDPLREAQRIASQASNANYDLIIVLGTGLGYHIHLIANSLPRTPIIAIEPQQDVYQQLKLYAYNKWYTLKNVKILHESNLDQHLYKLLNLLKPINPKLISLPAYDRVYPKVKEIIKKTLQEYLDSLKTNRATVKRFSFIWLNNILRNYNTLIKTPGIFHLKDKYHGIPAFILGSGPTLPNFIEFIRKYQEKAIIIATNASFRYLLSVGIEPEIVMVIDANPVCQLYIPPTPTFSSTLVFEPTVNPYLPLNYQGPKLTFNSHTPFFQIIKPYIGDKGSIMVGGSVITSALSLAHFLGLSPAIMFGVDLAYTYGLVHFPQAILEEHNLYRTDLFTSILTSHVKALLKSSVFIKDNQIVTQQLIEYGRWLKRYSQEYNYPIYRVTKSEQLKDIIKNLEGPKSKPKLSTEVLKLPKSTASTSLEIVLKNINNRLNKIEYKISKALKESSPTYIEFDEFNSYLLSPFVQDEIDTFSLKGDKESLVNLYQAIYKSIKTIKELIKRLLR